MIDEFEQYKARAYSGGTDTTVTNTASAPTRHCTTSTVDPEMNDGGDDDDVTEAVVAVTASFRPRRVEWPTGWCSIIVVNYSYANEKFAIGFISRFNENSSVMLKLLLTNIMFD